MSEKYLYLLRAKAAETARLCHEHQQPKAAAIVALLTKGAK